ncbi:MAG: hypothetical protein ACKPKO_31430 [Candidatus Fonsibacter sp.]
MFNSGMKYTPKGMMTMMMMMIMLKISPTKVPMPINLRDGT